jgi:uncharacterized damage-inducible protein DinB
MPRPLAEDPFELHAWAIAGLLDACEGLSAEQLAFAAPGAFGTVMDTLRHLVEGDRFQLWAAGAGVPLTDASSMGFEQLRQVAAENAVAWRGYNSKHPDGDERIVDIDDSGWQRTATVGLRLAQALQHGIEHRTQVCTAMTLLGLETPDLSGWEYGVQRGVVSEVLPQ